MSDDYGIEFEESRWFLCDDFLRIVNADAPLEQEPPGWPPLGDGRKARKAVEEVLESLLALNMEMILRERVRFLFRGGDYWGIQDLTGLDNLGRIHLFELKRNKVESVVPEQLGSYLLGTLFKSPEDYVEECWDLQRERLDRERWEVYLAGAMANLVTHTSGCNVVNSDHPAVVAGSRPAIRDSQWTGMTIEVQRELLIEAMLNRAATERGVRPPSRESITAWAEGTRRRLVGGEPRLPTLAPRQRAVIWLVGRDFDKGVFDRIRLWRSAGVDARCLVADARQSQATGRWMLRLQHEDFPERRGVLDQLAERFAAWDARAAGHELRLHFYEKRSASERDLSVGGRPLGGGASAALHDMHRDTPVETVAPRRDDMR